MELIKALKEQGHNKEDIKLILLEMSEDLINGANIDDILYSYNLELDYAIDLIDIALYFKVSNQIGINRN